MPINRIVVEIRRNLRCANIFLEFEQIRPKHDNGSFNITIEENQLRIRDYSDEFQIFINEDFKIETASLSNLIVEDKNASFRVSLDTGTYNNTNEQNSNDIFRTKSELAILPDSEFTLTCATCHVELFNNPKSFKRILEFPSGSIDVSEFFCHNGPNFSTALTPRISDIFYGFYFVIINLENLTNFKTKDEHLYCKRCLSYLGETLFDEKAAKLWNDHVSTKPQQPNKLFKTISHKYIIQELMEKIIYECSINKEIHCIQFAKIIIEACSPNRKKKFIMLNILEKSLDVLLNSNSELSGKKIYMRKSQAYKVLFKIEEDENNALLNFWKGDFNVHSIIVSNRLFESVANTLVADSSLLPVIYRYSNEFLLSYIFY